MQFETCRKQTLQPVVDALTAVTDSVNVSLTVATHGLLKVKDCKQVHRGVCSSDGCGLYKLSRVLSNPQLPTSYTPVSRKVCTHSA